MTRRARWWLVGLAAVAATGGVIAGVAASRAIHRAAQLLGPDALKARLEQELSTSLHLTATIRTLSATLYPRAAVVGEHLELRSPDNPELPPVIAIERFSISTTPQHLLQDIHDGHVEIVTVEGLTITIPPGEARAALTPSARTWSGSSRVVVDRLVTHDAELRILRAKPGQEPLVFSLHEFELRDLGVSRPVAFHATLTNPVPRGEVVSDGTVGPWSAKPSELPLDGTYTFRQADLDTIRGIGGHLTSEGRYLGTVTRIRVTGTTKTPDFNLDLGGRPVPLSTTFAAVVDGSNGTTHLDSLDARLFTTPVHVTGDIVNLPGPAGFDINLKAAVQGGRIEHILKLALVGRPPFSGAMTLNADVRVKAGHGLVRDRLNLGGSFALKKVQFADVEVERKLTELSQRGQGEDPDRSATGVLSDFRGDFQLAKGELDLSWLAFDLPGAAVELSGSYGLPTQAMEFEGQLRTKAALSNVVGGFKSLFIKPFDWVFRRDGAGAVIPISITGTREHPKFGVRIGAALLRGR